MALDRSEEGVWIIPPFAEPISDPAPGKTGSGSGVTVSRDPVEVSKDDNGAAPGRGSVAGETPKMVQSVSITGNVPLESWVELFRCFVSPAAKLGLKSLQLGIAFKFVAQDGQPLDPDNPALKAMREAARQLGIQIHEDGGA